MWFGVPIDRLFAADHVVAAGDVARWYRADLSRTVRLEHWTNAVKQASARPEFATRQGRCCRVADQPYVLVGSVWIRIEMLGLPSEHHDGLDRVGQPG